jgi:beta-fructofuranosidase
VDTTASSLDLRAKGAVKECPLPAADNMELEIFLDGSILELFANQKVSLTTRLYPTQMDDLHLYGYATAAGSHLVDFQMWEMGAYLIH